jgi:Flp pilus assembly protein TadG
MHCFLHHTSSAALLVRRARGEHGVALVEFALVVPIIVLLLFAMLDLGKAYNYWIDETQLAHEGARWAAVNQNPDPTEPNFLAALRKQADTAELRNGGTTSIPNPLQVCVYLPDGPVVGKRVRVEVTSTYQFLSFVAGKVGVLQTPVLAHSTMRLERVPSYSDGDCA